MRAHAGSVRHSDVSKMLPTFLVIGAAKCGTTTLCTVLGDHPDVFFSEPKEIHFFGRDDPHKTVEWYRSFFEESEEASAVGEGSTSYTHPDIIRACVSEIHASIPECRLIYMVREPLARLESDWKMRVHEGWSPPDINKAVQEQPTLIAHGLYWKNLNVYRKAFPDEQILVVFLEDFAADPHRELKRCFRHIGVDETILVGKADRVLNRSADFRSDRSLTRVLRQAKLIEHLQRAMPSWARALARSMLTKKDHIAPSWDPEIRKRTLECLEDDSLHLLEHCGKSPYFWWTEASDPQP